MRNRKWRSLMAMIIAGAMTAAVFAGCQAGGMKEGDAHSTEAEASGQESKADADEQEQEPVAELRDAGTVELTWIIDSGELPGFYDEYEENPIYRYWSSLDWEVPQDGEHGRISIDFTIPPADRGNEYVNTIIATGEYPDVLSTSLSTTGVAQLYDEGVILDLTDYVERYMPNYSRRLEESFLGKQLYNTVDGERKILQIFEINDVPQDSWCGYLFRRDWIVKYGKDADGNPFEGGWNEDKTVFTDNIVFPSGNTEPVYVSDWEWMLDIFQTALEEQGADADGYAMQLNYMGFIPFGDLSSGFGGVSTWYMDEDGSCHFGPTEDGFRAYIECLHTWYENGWINRGFEENTSDMMFWAVDSPSVYSGRVGCFYGMNPSSGNGLDNGDPLLDGICMWPAASPINDVYGDASVQNIVPFMSFATCVDPTSVVLTNKMADKDIGLFLTAYDYLFSDEGGLLAKHGLSDKLQAEVQDEFYNSYDLGEGLYTMTEDGVVSLNPKGDLVEGLTNAARLIRVPGYYRSADVDHHYPQARQATVTTWNKYPNSGNITGMITGQMSVDDAQDYSMTNTNIRTFMERVVPEFIIGERDIKNDAQWQAFCDEINAFNPGRYTEIINDILGNK